MTPTVALQELDNVIRRCESCMPMIHTPAYRNQAFLIELARCLHNYTAAAYSLQQHIDVFQKMISDSVFQEEVKQMFANAGSAAVADSFKVSETTFSTTLPRQW